MTEERSLTEQSPFSTQSYSTIEDVIYCCDDYGQLFAVPPADLLFSPAVYGIFMENKQVLLQSNRDTGRKHLPGGLVDRLQAPEQAMRQYFREATGMMPVIQSLIMVDDRYYYDGESGYRLSVLYYLLEQPGSGRLTNLIDFGNEARPEWVSLSELQRQDMQFGYDAIQNVLLHNSS